MLGGDASPQSYCIALEYRSGPGRKIAGPQVADPVCGWYPAWGASCRSSPPPCMIVLDGGPGCGVSGRAGRSRWGLADSDAGFFPDPMGELAGNERTDGAEGVEE